MYKSLLTLGGGFHKVIDLDLAHKDTMPLYSCVKNSCHKRKQRTLQSIIQSATYSIA